ncbi:MAG: hypothetical protein HYW78_00970 [Parcubacteria group bacterium]|nr:hypothetical protein [Parcubacteria group bacterium]
MTTINKKQKQQSKASKESKLLAGQAKVSENDSLIRCAFCRGAGFDRFGIPSKLSQCQACKGRGKVYVPEPNEKCASCLGTGVYRHHRLTCSVCGGKGRVRTLNRVRGEGCEKENEEALNSETGLPCISAYELGKSEEK